MTNAECKEVLKRLAHNPEVYGVFHETAEALSHAIRLCDEADVAFNKGFEAGKINIEVERWRRKREEFNGTNPKYNEPINYNATLTRFADQLNVPLWKAMAFGKYFNGVCPICQDTKKNTWGEDCSCGKGEK